MFFIYAYRRKKMGVLSELKPERLFYYFEELTKIPHGSYNVDRISDYIASFGRDHDLETYQDELKNVVIIKEASEGYEDEPPLIIQGHMDMVAVSVPGLDIDMKTEPLKAAINAEEDYIYAEGTSLGGDDGIAVATALALLEDDTLKHPRLEVVITTNEETGMEGARGIDLSMLSGNRLLNLDSEDEGIFLTSCAGGLRINADIPVKEAASSDKYQVREVEIGGLLGGHSGEEIIKGRANSNKLAARLLFGYSKYSGERVYITYIEGGLADNAIPRVTKIGVAAKNSERFEIFIKEFESYIKDEYHKKDPDLYVRINDGKDDAAESTAIYDVTDAVKFLFTVPNGVQTMSSDIEGLVETSLNLGIVSLNCDDKTSPVIHATFSVRSSIESAKFELADRVICLAESYGGKAVISGNYPGWAYRADSPLRDKMCALYEEMYGKKPVLKAIHAGLECGLLSDKITDLDCVSIGPDMKDIHTTEEKLYISSSRRVYEFVRALIEKKG